MKIHLNSKLIIALLATIPSTLADVNGRCTGKDGICISTSTCDNYNGKNSVGYCPKDANNIRCCDNIPCKSNGINGKCMFTNQCKGTTVGGLCPGGADFKCCLEPTKCTAEGKSGECINTSQCTGNRKSVPGYCPGAADIQCCIEKETKCTAEGKSGVCINTSQCTGNRKSVPGYCPGAANIQCCIEKDSEPKCTAEGKSGVCINTSQCTGNRKSVPGYCPGAANIQCCIEIDSGPKCTAEGKSGVCINTSQCTGNRKSVPGYCPGAANIQCCIEKGSGNSHTISQKGIDLVKEFEGCYLKAYWDSNGKKWTIGYGITSDDKSITGTNIYDGLTISQATANEWLKLSLNQIYGPKVDKYDDIYHWSQNEFDALCSFAYNIGSIDQLTANGSRSKSVIASKMLEYVYSNGERLPGLVRRREAESKMFKGNWTNKKLNLHL